MLRLVCTASLTAVLCAAQASAQTDEKKQYDAEVAASMARCPAEPAPETVEIREADPAANPALHELMRKTLVEKVKQANATILLGPKVVIDFSDAPHLLPLSFEKPCVTLMSVAAFQPGTGPIFTARHNRLFHARRKRLYSAFKSGRCHRSLGSCGRAATTRAACGLRAHAELAGPALALRQACKGRLRLLPLNPLRGGR